jgi:hypothetical protein
VKHKGHDRRHFSGRWSGKCINWWGFETEKLLPKDVISMYQLFPRPHAILNSNPNAGSQWAHQQVNPTYICTLYFSRRFLHTALTDRIWDLYHLSITCIGALWDPKIVALRHTVDCEWLTRFQNPVFSASNIADCKPFKSFETCGKQENTEQDLQADRKVWRSAMTL